MDWRRAGGGDWRARSVRAPQRRIDEPGRHRPRAHSGDESRQIGVGDGGRIAQRFETRIILRKRSEEHTSELQSLMRISYAVFCLKKKKKPDNIHSNKACKK